MAEEFDSLRMCRYKGRKPTMRERWIAFHRLYRAAKRMDRGTNAFRCSDSLRVLMPDWRWIRLEETFDRMPYNAYPKTLRRAMLERDRAARWFRDWSEHDKDACRLLAQEGREVTPTEVAETRRRVIVLARRKAAELGISVPSSDLEFMRLLSDGLP